MWKTRSGDEEVDGGVDEEDVVEEEVVGPDLLLLQLQGVGVASSSSASPAQRPPWQLLGVDSSGCGWFLGWWLGFTGEEEEEREKRGVAAAEEEKD